MDAWHMNLVSDAIAWLTSRAHWSGAGSIPSRLGEHLSVTGIVLLVALFIALPLGIAIGHLGRGVAFVVAISGAARALPTLGLVTLLGIWLGIGLKAPVIALVVLAVPPLLAGIYAGMQAVDRDVVDTARAVGMTEWTIIRSVELPLALPSIVAGMRSATLQVVSTVTVAAYIADDGFGRYILEGLRTRRYDEMLAGALLVIALALVLDRAFALLEWYARPPGSATRFRIARTGDDPQTRRGVLT
jgi:osmoprotectant transport system permease protein